MREHQVEAGEADEAVHAGQVVLAEGPLQHRDPGHQHHLGQQQHARHEAGQLPEREDGGAAGETRAEAAVGHPPVGRRAAAPSQSSAPRRPGTARSTAARLGPVTEVATGRRRAVMSPVVRSVEVLWAVVVPLAVRNLTEPGAGPKPRPSPSRSKPAGPPCSSTRSSSPPAVARPTAKPPRPPASRTAAAPPATTALARVSQGRRRRLGHVVRGDGFDRLVGLLPAVAADGGVSSLMPDTLQAEAERSRGSRCQSPVNAGVMITSN